MFKSIISLAFLLWCSLCEWYQNYQIVLPENTIAFDYSTDSQYIWAISLSQIWVLQSRRGQIIWRNSYKDINLSTAGFNSNSSLLAVASQKGQVLVYERNGRDFQNFASYKDSNHSSKIKSLCFSIDGHSIVLGFYHDLIVVWDTESNKNASKSFQSQYVLSVACSPISANRFIVSGGNSSIGSLVSYQFNMTQKVIVIENKTTVKQNASTSCVYSSDGEKVYRVGDYGFIYVYDNKWAETTLKVNRIDSEILKIRVSQNQRIIAVLLPNKIDIFNPSTSESFVETIDITTTEMSLSRHNPHILNFKQNQAWISGECLLKQFVNDSSGECESCDVTCLYCEQNVSNCYFCEIGAYLQDRKCLLCESKVKYCKECEQGGKCTVCNYGLNRELTQEGVCDCQLGFYEQNEICESCEIFGCSKCYNSTYCIECFSNYSLNNSSHRCECKIGYLDELQQKCLNCTQGCITCGLHDNCYSCDNGYNLNGQECLKNGLNLGIFGGIFAVSVGLPILVYLGVGVLKKRKTVQIEEQYENLE